MQTFIHLVSRRRVLQVPCSLVIAASLGCMAPWLKKPDPESPEAQQTKREAIRKILASDDRPRLIADIAAPRAMTISRMENLALVTCLPGTGGAVNAGPQRERMLDTMRRNDTDKPNLLLDDPNTAMVVAFVNIPPAARRGAILNAGVRLSSHAEGTDLRTGWLMPADLSEASLLENKLRQGFELVSAEGPIVTQAQVTGSQEPDASLTGFVVGGARLHKDRPIGIIFHPDFADALTHGQVLPKINHRFTVFDGHKKDGVATPKNDSIQVAVPPRYQFDVYHYINVVLSLGFTETEEYLQQRIEVCKQQLMNPTTARAAAWQLEAIGKEMADVLATGLSHSSPEVQFYAAYSLAYLNDPRAVNTLSQLAKTEPAFRAMCLIGLTVLDHFEAEDALVELLHANDAETRYGAVLALRRRDPNMAQVTGVKIGDAGSILEIPSHAPPLVAVSLETYPEVVIFGRTPMLKFPSFVYINRETLLKPDGPGSVTISRFAPNQEDRVVQCKTDLQSLLAGIVEVGGNYGDWVSFIRECSANGYLSESFAMNPIPSAGREYHREEKRSVDDENLAKSTTAPENEVEAEKTTTTWYNPLTWFSR